MEIPCKNCLLIPACRRKAYMHLMKNCSLLTDMLYLRSNIENERAEGFEKHARQVHEILNPDLWDIEILLVAGR